MELVAQWRVEVLAAFRERDWETLGYRDWDAYLSGEFGAHRVRLPRSERQQIVAALREGAMSTRAIASAIGVSRETVRTDLQAARDQVNDLVRGLNGKTYRTRRRPKRPASESSTAPRQPTKNDADRAIRGLAKYAARIDGIRKSGLPHRSRRALARRSTAELVNGTESCLRLLEDLAREVGEDKPTVDRLRDLAHRAEESFDRIRAALSE
ncbi:hypothetical protein BIV57_07970 [Mangrovactinospora gilvigrisea]|uniref:HTH deoR-type domain-containing protein n=1 Tax=Mangrovactinospora gilvigrisea TaxID=1428644 RepID=A0A1J7BH31_9ACTN|nr:DeoR family transcriptional regulator [Mangrovactinospora gilvigrisea]OIV38003.1 hypothetical protein BIV57_07970 [Mangrovactinospora gilvigrisea]